MGGMKSKPAPEPVDPRRGTAQGETVLLEEDADLLDEERALLTLDRFRATAHQQAGGARASYAWLLLVGGIIGAYSSIELVLAEIALIRDPDAKLSCNLNPLVGCGNSLSEWQSHLLFGWPNALVGSVVFGVVIAVGVMFLAGARVARWFWQLMSLTVLAGLVFVAWFAYHSIASFGILCPWCMVTWAVVMLLAPNTWAAAAQGGQLPVGDKLARVLYFERWLIVAGLFLTVVVVVAVAFWNEWLLLLGI